ncbi:hypothetical protein Tco_1109240 [Tanacetum coccineum]
MVEPEKPLKKKDQIALNEELALRLHAEEQAELEKERVAQEEATRAAIIKELDSIQAMIKTYEKLVARLQAEEQEQFSIKEKSRMFMEMIAERKIFFNMGEYKHNQLKGRSYEEIQMLFDKAYKEVNSFVPMDSEAVKSSETRTEGSSKRAGDELKSDKSKKQKIDEHVEAKKDDDPEEIDKDGRMGYFKLIRADGSSKSYSSMIKMLQDIDREDLETLWKLVKVKHGNTRPGDDYERVLWADQKVMFELDIKSEIWRNLQGYKVTIWKLFDTCGLQLLSDYYCWKDYADRDEIKDLSEKR